MSELETQGPIVAPKATLFVERKIQVRDYESLVVGMHYPVDLPTWNADGVILFGDHLTQVDLAIRAAFVTVKSLIFEQLGLEYEDKNGVLIEKVASHFKGAAEVVIQTAPSNVMVPAARQAWSQPSAAGAAHPVFGTCAGCGGTEFWDNRESKASGKYKATAPDGKCKSKECSKGKWLNR